MLSILIIVKTIESCIHSQQTLFSLERSFFIFCFEFCEIADKVLLLFTVSLFTHAKDTKHGGGGGWSLRSKRESSLPFWAGVQFSHDSLRAFNDRIKIRENRGLRTTY